MATEQRDQKHQSTPWPADAVTRIALLEREVRDLSHDLYGNGQPGAIGKLEARLDAVDARLTKVDDKLGRILVVVGALAGGSGLGLGAVLKALYGVGG